MIRYEEDLELEKLRLLYRVYFPKRCKPIIDLSNVKSTYKPDPRLKPPLCIRGEVKYTHIK